MIVLAVLWLASASPGSAQALRGVALVIGNSAYEHLAALPNPANDARAVENLLNGLGFETSLSSDRDARRLARDLRDFVEDAEGADVAIVYYAGHGIEAGGENFLVPVDADLSALDAAGEKLVPVSSFIEKLQATVPVAIVMLDACRDNPFPAGSLVRLDASAKPAPMGEVGLGETRGATRLTAPAPEQVESYGTVLAFAAEPGRVALDGEPGGNSPYTQAVLRHFDAMAGEEFGTVMRMVAEEVYLKTAGAQRPWVNESLRRLLYLGTAPAPLSGEEGELLSERRQLLVTIASLPDPELRRGQMERISAERGVPLDAVYGMLRALGSDTPDDPSELENLLRGEAERFATILAEREAINSPDPEIVRLSALADRAEREGLLSAADTFRERAKARYLETETTLEQQQAALDQRFVEGAATFARSAETKALAFNHLAAAHDYAEAFARVENRDRQLAWRYKRSEMRALTDHGEYKGDNAALERAIEAGRQALRMAEDLGDEAVAAARHDLGGALQTLGKREGGAARLEAAIATYRAALETVARERAPLDWALIQSDLGNALQALGDREGGTASLEQALEAYRAALQEYTRQAAPLDWARTHNNLAVTLSVLGERESGTARLEQAVAAYRAALEEWTRERVPLDWAMTQSNLGVVLQEIGLRESGTARLEEAEDAYRAALQERTRERVPLEWAETQNNLGAALQMLGERENDTARLETAVETYRAALEERTRERVPLQWAATQNNLGAALQALGEREEGTARLEQAAETYRAALEENTRERVPLEWARTQYNLGNVLAALGEREGGTGHLEQAAEAYRASLQERTRERVPVQWAATQHDLGNALIELGKRSASIVTLEDGLLAMAAAWEVFREAGYTQYDDHFRQRLLDADAALTALE